MLGVRTTEVENLILKSELKSKTRELENLKDKDSTLVQHEKAATFLDILKSFFRPTLVRV